MRFPKMPTTQISRQGGMVECRLTDGKPLVSLPASDAEEEEVEAGTPEDEECLESGHDYLESRSHYLKQFIQKFDQGTVRQLAHIQREKRNGGDELAVAYGETNPAIKSLNQKRQQCIQVQLVNKEIDPEFSQVALRELRAIDGAIQQLLRLNGYDEDGNKLHRSAHGDTFLKRGAEKMKAEMQMPQSED